MERLYKGVVYFLLFLKRPQVPKSPIPQFPNSPIPHCSSFPDLIFKQELLAGEQVAKTQVLAQSISKVSTEGNLLFATFTLNKNSDPGYF